MGASRQIVCINLSAALFLRIQNRTGRMTS